ncbi:tetratricopeptide (TPR) repeat protein [Allocatelliglobosispora scoriae]|uniref:Tetratricopeptide (TPR) repeat protein n=1 Tax=Allocatelliglobosispora scoriae TaxID=643052 RepID=A0A841BJK1_9ACTN|nr:NB-ARC domain-containing protein [Allocatelliglobosispora scoriae]MBB5868434.1 tetratricopeptide (TPR) repeat protein [Allocatelliglobosispora scoriae]
MSSNLSSLTCYALIRAIEHDLRTLLSTFCGEHPVEQVFDAAMLAKTIERRLNDRRKQTDHTSLTALLPYVDFGDALALMNKLRPFFPEDTREGLVSLRKALEGAIPVRNRVAHSRPLELGDLPKIVDLAEELSGVAGFPWPELNSTQRQLAENPAFVISLRPDLRKDRQSAVSHNLPDADFDETGLLGRRVNRAELLDELLHGPWPVVSLLGEGGIGKTALALQVAYDLVDHPECPFEIVVWTTAKSEVLTTSEIKRIPGAIQDSMGVFERTATQLAGPAGAENPIAEVRTYLSEFRTLLILDNLETVMDERVLDFIVRVPRGSKVLITSRFGVKDQRGINLAPLDEKEATHLLRSLARARRVSSLASLTGEEASHYVQRMNRHPGFIKWFVAGVELGRESPEQLLRKEDLVLDFCMRNVFDQLSADARTLLQSLLIATGSHTRAELAFLNGFDAARTETAAYELLRTNFVTQMAAGVHRDALALSDFARKYMRKNHPPTLDQQRHISARQRELIKIGGELQYAHSRNPYAPDTLEIRDPGDFHAAGQLRIALDDAAAGQFSDSIERCIQARALAPGYPEPHRVMGYIFDLANNLSEAQNSYQNAVEMSSTSPYVRYFYGRFLVTNQLNPYEGLRMLQEAHELDPDSLLVEVGIAQAHLELEAYNEATQLAMDLLKRPDITYNAEWDCICVLLGAVEALVRRAESPASHDSAARMIARLVEAVELVNVAVLDAYVLDMCLFFEHWARRTARSNVSSSAAQAYAAAASRLRERRRQADPNHMERLVGTIKSKPLDKTFGFIVADSQEYFLHEKAMDDPNHFYEIDINSTVAFYPGQHTAGNRPPARNVRWLL